MDLLALINFDAERAVNLISENKQSIIYQINKDSPQHTYFGTNELEHEIEKLNLTISHKDDLLEQKEREIQLLQDLVNTLQNK
ncbi:hypothetical protein QG077_06470 [Kingella kingae]|uniref:hypothetical protein n=1 Tax=Kingella kingae TaxID=504 RepID=UPI00254C2984|nr:hypothetical protein [Kingella kingae]MDK4596905.1 hypothetical protein [Kingella kingae]MDK4600887.1 hypothetical protein [Kingella kingae]MDK4654584.1 hypothetical protein [Kingella kingae]